MAVTVKDFLKLFRNPQVVVDIVDMGDESIARVNANGKDILKDEISGREIYDIKIINAGSVKIIVTEVEDVVDPADPADPTGTP